MRMPVIGLVEVAEAMKCAGDETVELFVGEETLTAAKAEAVRMAKTDTERMAFRNVNRSPFR